MRFEIQGLNKREKRIIKIVVVWTVAIILIQIGILHGRKVERAEWQGRQQIEADILFVRFLGEIIQRESSGKHDGIWGDEGKSYGIAQFQERTFYWLAEKASLQDPDWKDESQQITLLAWAVKNGYGGLWTSVLQIEKEVEDFLEEAQ